MRCRNIKIIGGLTIMVVFLLSSPETKATQVSFNKTDQKFVSDTGKREAYLKGILKLLPDDLTRNGRVSYLDKTFKDWLARTGELPPDFDKMPSIPYLPNPLVIDEGGDLPAGRILSGSNCYPGR